MAANELAFQTQLVKSVVAQGGYGTKLSNRFKAGVSDLLLSHPHRGVALIECKHLGDCPDRFSRQTGITPLQQEFLRKYQATQKRNWTAQLVYVKHLGKMRAVVIPWSVNTLTSGYVASPCWVEFQPGREPRWDVERIMEMVEWLKN